MLLWTWQLPFASHLTTTNAHGHRGGRHGPPSSARRDLRHFREIEPVAPRTRVRALLAARCPQELSRVATRAGLRARAARRWQWYFQRGVRGARRPRGLARTLEQRANVCTRDSEKRMLLFRI